MRQTATTDNNRKDFYKSVYRQQNDPKERLIDLSQLPGKIIAIDCCGWHYRDLFPEKTLICLETLSSVLQFKFEIDKFDKLIDDRDIKHLIWPNVNVDDCSLIFDRSNLFRYHDIGELSGILSTTAEKYHPKTIIVKAHTQFIDDNRLTDRFYNISKISVPGFVITRVLYDTVGSIYELSLKCKI